jgi:hypothetical protein
MRQRASLESMPARRRPRGAPHQPSFRKALRQGLEERCGRRGSALLDRKGLIRSHQPGYSRRHRRRVWPASRRSTRSARLSLVGAPPPLQIPALDQVMGLLRLLAVVPAFGEACRPIVIPLGPSHRLACAGCRVDEVVERPRNCSLRPVPARSRLSRQPMAPVSKGPNSCQGGPSPNRPI